jgi:hypothetical protein
VYVSGSGWTGGKQVKTGFKRGGAYDDGGPQGRRTRGDRVHKETADDRGSIGGKTLAAPGRLGELGLSEACWKVC